MTYDRDPKYLHPYIAVRLKQIMEAIQEKLPATHSPKLISAHRTPSDQFELFKKGRTFRNGGWVKIGSVVTNLDGFIKRSRHNYLPCTAFDTGLFSNGKYVPETPLYKHIKQGVKLGMDWGGNWVSFKDQPHLEIPTSKFFKTNIEKDSGLIWQKYLVKAGTYAGVLDGIFGPKSLAALKAATNENDRNLAAWDKLFARFGVLEDFDQ